MQTNEVDNKIHKFYIFPCLQELKKGVESKLLEPEQIPADPSYLDGKNEIVKLKSDPDKYIDTSTSSDKFDKIWWEKKNDYLRKKYLGHKIMIPYMNIDYVKQCRDMDISKKWQSYIDFFSKETKYKTNYDAKVAFIVSHHNRMKSKDEHQGLIPLKDKEFNSYANNFCLKITIEPTGQLKQLSYYKEHVIMMPNKIHIPQNKEKTEPPSITFVLNKNHDKNDKENVKFEIISDGFPDKTGHSDEYKYLISFNTKIEKLKNSKKQEYSSEVHENIVDVMNIVKSVGYIKTNDMYVQEMNNKEGYKILIDHILFDLEEINSLYCKKYINCEPIILAAKNYQGDIPLIIYVIRHGNAMHNQPLKVKKIDSPLTPLGMFQAKKLSEKIKNDIYKKELCSILCCSFLQRSQLTGLILLKELDMLSHGMIELCNKMIKIAYNRCKMKSLEKFYKYSPVNGIKSEIDEMERYILKELTNNNSISQKSPSLSPSLSQKSLIPSLSQKSLIPSLSKKSLSPSLSQKSLSPNPSKTAKKGGKSVKKTKKCRHK